MAAATLQQQLINIAGPCHAEKSEELAPLLNALQVKYGDALQAIVLYGSCLRNGDFYEGLVDFYAIVDDYRHAHNSAVSAWFNACLPPNVYYLECVAPQGVLRAKYAVLSLPQLEHGATYWFQSGVWGRFAQPLGLVYTATPAIADRVRAACGTAVVSLLQRALPALAPRLDIKAAFAGALTLSYATELRVESKARGSDIISANEVEYRRRLIAALPLLPFPNEVDDDGRVAFNITARQRRIATLAWPLRRVQGKLISVLRLVKACFTFNDAIDYAAWKLKRHTGVEIEVTPRLRRHPLIFGWPVLWRLYRGRALR